MSSACGFWTSSPRPIHLLTAPLPCVSLLYPLPCRSASCLCTAPRSAPPRSTPCGTPSSTSCATLPAACPTVRGLPAALHWAAQSMSWLPRQRNTQHAARRLVAASAQHAATCRPPTAAPACTLPHPYCRPAAAGSLQLGRWRAQRGVTRAAGCAAAAGAAGSSSHGGSVGGAQPAPCARRLAPPAALTAPG